MKVELELPPLPNGWANEDVVVEFGHAPKQSLILSGGGWVPVDVFFTGLRVYAVRKS